MLAALKEKHDQAIFNNFRRCRGAMFLRYSVKLNDVWHPLDTKEPFMPKCIYTMPPVDIAFDLSEQLMFSICANPRDMAEALKILSSRNSSTIQTAVKQEGINQLEFTTTLYSIIGKNESTVFYGSKGDIDEDRIVFSYGRDLYMPYVRRIEYDEIMNNMYGSMLANPSRLTCEELDDIIAYYDALAATNPEV